MKKLILIVFLLSCASIASAQCSIQSTGTGSVNSVGSWQCSVGLQVIGTENGYCTVGTSPELTEGTTTWGATDDIANLPARCMYTGIDATPSFGNTITAADSAALTSALSNANCGDTIVLTAGATYVGPFNLAKICDGLHWITIKSSQYSNAAFPLPGVRITPCAAGLSNDGVNGRSLPGYPDYACSSFPAVLTAKIQAGTAANSNAITASAGADHYRLMGIEIVKDPTHAADALVQLAADGLTSGPRHIIFDRVIIHGDQWTPANAKLNETGNGISAKNSQWIALINSYGYDTYCTSSCVDSHIYSAGTGLFEDGPHKLYNNMMATAGEPFMIGGGGQGPGTPNSKDLEIRVNHLFKPLTWMVPINSCPNYYQAITKNLSEFKNGIGALIEANFFENSWQGCQSDQTGYAFLLTPKSQNNSQNMTVTFDGSNIATTTSNFTHHTGTSPLSGNPVDPVNCPVGGCVLSDSTNGVEYRFCNGVNGCDQSGVANLKCGTGVNAGLACTTNAQCPGSYCAPTTSARLTATAPAASVTAKACVPGDCPNCRVQDVTFRFNEIYNTTNGLQVVTGLSTTCKDQALGMARVSVHDNVLHGLSREMSNGNDPYNQSTAFSLSNGSVPPGVIQDVKIRHNTVAVETGNNGGVSGLGNQVDHTDSQYLQGIAITDNIAPAPWSISRSNGTAVTKGIGGQSGLANEYAVSACQRYFTVEAPSGTLATAGVQNFTFAGLPAGGSNYLVSLNGQYTAITSQTPTSFSVTAATKAGDTINVRDLGDCDWLFSSNVLGKGISANFHGSGSDESPYPNPNSCGAGNTNNCILDESQTAGIFTNNFISWGTGRDGNYGISGSSPFFHAASDILSRPPSGASPGADFTLLNSKASGVRSATFFPPLTVQTSSLPTATAGIAYNASLQASFGASQFWDGYKGWYLETDPTKCGGNCGSVNNGTVHSGIIINRGGLVNGPIPILNVSRTGCPASCLSNYTVSSTIAVGAWEVGQTVSLAQFLNGTTAATQNDSSFNGTCVITALGTNSFSCPMTNGVNSNIVSHAPNGPKSCGISGTSQCDSIVSFAPISAGTYSFWVRVQDGAFQVARAQVSVTTVASGPQTFRPSAFTDLGTITALNPTLAYDADINTSAQLLANSDIPNGIQNFTVTRYSFESTFTGPATSVVLSVTSSGSKTAACTGGEIIAMQYSTNGGTSFTNVPNQSGVHSKRTDTVSLSTSQDLRNLVVQGTASCPLLLGSGGDINPFEISVAVQ